LQILLVLCLSGGAAAVGEASYYFARVVVSLDFGPPSPTGKSEMTLAVACWLNLLNCQNLSYKKKRKRVSFIFTEFKLNFTYTHIIYHIMQKLKIT
jgi:hypothetical protein